MLDSKIVGYGEIWAEADEIELARLIVHPENFLAKKLYMGAGFEVASNDEQKVFNEGQPIEYILMSI